MQPYLQRAWGFNVYEKHPDPCHRRQHLQEFRKSMKWIWSVVQTVGFKPGCQTHFSSGATSGRVKYAENSLPVEALTFFCAATQSIPDEKRLYCHKYYGKWQQSQHKANFTETFHCKVKHPQNFSRNCYVLDGSSPLSLFQVSLCWVATFQFIFKNSCCLWAFCSLLGGLMGFQPFAGRFWSSGLCLTPLIQTASYQSLCKCRRHNTRTQIQCICINSIHVMLPVF